MKVFQGWKSYYEHNVRDAGIGMAILWLTVLGFDNITLGYCKQQGVSESVLGILTGVSALVGVAGTRLYPVLLCRFSDSEFLLRIRITNPSIILKVWDQQHRTVWIHFPLTVSDSLCGISLGSWIPICFVLINS